MKKENINDMTCEEMMRHLRHFLTQHSSYIEGLAEVLLHEDGPGFVNDQQKELLIMLKKSSSDLRKTTLEIDEWLKHQSD